MALNDPPEAPPAEVGAEESEDAEALFASLEEEDNSAYRTQRVQELRDEINGARAGNALSTIKTTYVTLRSDEEALRFTTEHERAVVHFFHPDFARCHTMDNHCQTIADRHAEYGDADASFGRIDVKDAPFIVEKLGVRVLPCLIGFVKGVAKGRVTGFEGLCWNGKEDGKDVTRALEQTFVDWSVLKQRFILDHEDNQDSSDDDDEENGWTSKDPRRTRGIQGRKQKIEDDDDDWD